MTCTTFITTHFYWICVFCGSLWEPLLKETALINAKTRQVLSWGLSIFFSLIVIVWAVFALDWQAVKLALLNAHYGWVLAGVGLIFLTFFVRAWRWRFLLWPDLIPLTQLFSALVIGQAVNYIAPARLGDFARAYVIGETAGISKARALGTVALEKLWDIVMLLIFTFAIGWFFPLPEWLSTPTRVILLGTVVVAVILALLLWRQADALAWIEKRGQRFAPGLFQRMITFSQNLLQGFSSLKNFTAMLGVTGSSLLVWILGALTNYVIFLAFNLDLPLIAALILLVVLQVGVAVPSLPGRIGVFEGLCVVVLALFNIPFDVAFSYGLVLHAVVFVPPIVLAVILSLQLNLKLNRAQLAQMSE